MILVDCDCLKDINDTYGHLAGIQSLTYMAENLKQYLAHTDIIGRIGEDEFCVYMKNISSAASVRNICQTLVNENRKTNKTINLSVSVGTALTLDNEPHEDVFKKADAALYQAKRKGKSSVVLYDK